MRGQQNKHEPNLFFAHFSIAGVSTRQSSKKHELLGEHNLVKQKVVELCNLMTMKALLCL